MRCPTCPKAVRSNSVRESAPAGSVWPSGRRFSAVRACASCGTSFRDGKFCGSRLGGQRLFVTIPALRLPSQHPQPRRTKAPRPTKRRSPERTVSRSAQEKPRMSPLKRTTGTEYHAGVAALSASLSVRGPVTEVYRPGRWSRPGVRLHAGERGTPRPVRSSSWK